MMRKTLLTSLLLILCCIAAPAQSKPSVSILGDSYSTFEGWLTPDTCAIWYFSKKPDTRRTDVRNVRETWWWQVIKRMDWKLEVNNSFSGATICNTGYRDEDYSDRSFITRLDRLGSPDVILIFGGTNDSWAGAPVGDYKYEGWRRGDLYFFRPAMAYLLDKTRERYPTADIYFISNDGLKESVTGSIHEICRHYNVPVIQLTGIDKQNSHPNIAGMKQIADQVCEALKKME